MRWDESTSTNDRGFTIVEVLIAMLLLAITSLGVAGLFGMTSRATHAARNQTSTAVLASQKMEQLRALTWGFDNSGQYLPVSDTTTNLALMPPDNTGEGLNPSPDSSLDQNTSGYVDYLNARGQYIGTGATPPAETMFIRRWRIQPLPTNPNNTLVIQVLVTTAKRERDLQSGLTNRKRYADDALITTVKTRKAN
jgi:prepilin-type N-terminal cleavage/methylation domain-containing protein